MARRPIFAEKRPKSARFRLYGGPPLRYVSPPMIRKAGKTTIKTKPNGALGSCA
jgi:hypothetical protein